MGNTDISQLRELLLNLDQTELDKLKRLLNYPNDLAQEIATVLPEAVLFSLQKGEKLSTALVPMIESVITRSVAQNPRLLADALYPVIGRSIRKSINEEFKKLLLTFNELIENTFSYRAIRWRYQALVTGRKYSEVVISNTIKYKAEHVFLIHKETGLLLCDVHDELSRSADPDAISGMLKAISDFVHDSFQNTGNSELNLIELEDYQVLIEQGPHAIIASLVKGFALDEYRTILESTLEKIHDEYAASFLSFKGDTFIFETSRDYLFKCLRTEKKEEYKKQKSKIGLLVAIPVLAVLLFFLGRTVYFSLQWRNYIRTLKQSDLILLSQHGKTHRYFYVKGFILPGATHPDSLLGDYQFPKDKMNSNWHVYLNGNDAMLETFVKNNIILPPDIELKINNSSIVLSGTGSKTWLANFMKFVEVNLSWFDVNTENFKVFSDEDLASDIAEFNKYKLYFDLGSTNLNERSASTQEELIANLFELIDKAGIVNKKLSLNINGYADQYGDTIYNKLLSRNRAETVRKALIYSGISDAILKVEGMGILEGNENLSAEERRRVDFQLTVKP